VRRPRRRPPQTGTASPESRWEACFPTRKSAVVAPTKNLYKSDPFKKSKI
jgi:hypothetical protein